MSPGEAKAVELLAPAAPGLDCFLTSSTTMGPTGLPMGPPRRVLAPPGLRWAADDRRAAGVAPVCTRFSLQQKYKSKT